MEQAMEMMRKAFKTNTSAMRMCGHYKFEVFNGIYLDKDGRPTYEEPSEQ